MTMHEAAVDCFVNPPTDLDYQGRAFFCLAFVRSIVQRAYAITWDQFYLDVVGEKVERPNGLPKYWIARDAERAMRRKWSVKPSNPKPGDILFKWDAFKNKHGIYEGHVGVYIGPMLFMSKGKWISKRVVIENAKSAWRTTLASKGNIILSDFDNWPAVTTYARLPETREELLRRQA